MESLLTTFIAAALGEFGDKTQLLVIALVARYGRPAPILAGVLIAAAITSTIAAAGGVVIHDMIVLRATALLVALAFLIAGVTGLFRAKTPGIASPAGMPILLVTLICFLAAEFGDKTQFTTAALAAHYDSLALAAFGATAGIVAANMPAAMFGARFVAALPVRKIRLCVSIIFIMVGTIVALHATRLI